MFTATPAWAAPGDPLWASLVDGPAPGVNSLDRGEDIAIGADGTVYVTGTVYLTGDSDGGTATGYDYATAGYSSSGRGCGRLTSTPVSSSTARAIAVDSSTGTVYVTGQSYAGPAGWDAATLAYADGGVQLWHSRFGGRTGSGTPYGIAVDPDNGNVDVTGEVNGATTGQDCRTTASSPTMAADRPGLRRRVRHAFLPAGG